MSFFKFFWFSGRAPRWVFWFLVSPPWLIFGLAFYNFLFPEDQILPFFTDWIIDLVNKTENPATLPSTKPFSYYFEKLFFLFYIYVYHVVIVKRLHDRNKSGLWLLAIYLPYAWFMVYFVFQDHLSDIRNSSYFLLFFGILYVFSWIISIRMFVELGFFAGTKGPNKYGPDPRKS